MQHQRLIRHFVQFCSCCCAGVASTTHWPLESRGPGTEGEPVDQAQHGAAEHTECSESRPPAADAGSSGAGCKQACWTGHPKPATAAEVRGLAGSREAEEHVLEGAATSACSPADTA